MSRIETRYGPLEGETAEIEFPAGLPGFEGERRFVLATQPETAPLRFLQSCQSPELCFLTLPVNVLEPEYELRLSDGDCAVLGLGGEPQPADLACLAIVCWEGETPSANLAAPVVIHIPASRGVQAVRDDTRYAVRHPLPGREESPCS